MATNREYKSEIINASRDLTVKEKIMLKDVKDCVSINDTLANSDGNALFINVDTWVQVHIHNEKAQGDKDYDVIIIVDKDGIKYTTGSESFINEFIDMAEEMKACPEEDFSIKAMGLPSKNFTGRDFLTCVLI